MILILSSLLSKDANPIAHSQQGKKKPLRREVFLDI